MTLAEAGEIFAYWDDNPPAHLMLQAIARLFGWVPHPVGAVAPGIDEIAAAAPPGLRVTRRADIAMPAPLDRDALQDRNRLRARAIAERNRAEQPIPLSVEVTRGR